MTPAGQWTGRIQGLPGGIPSRAKTCAALNPGVTAVQITAAIAACPTGETVLLSAGTYNLSAGISFKGKNNVTLRGAGPDKTFLVFTGAIDCVVYQASVCLSGSSFSNVENPTNFTNAPRGSGGPIHQWTAGFSQGTTVLTFDSTSGWAVNQVLILDQFDDTADTGGVFVGDKTQTFIQEGVTGRHCPNTFDLGCGSRSGSRLQNEIKIITAINGNQVTISPALYMPNWRASQGPQAWSPGVAGGNVGTMIGLESLSVDSANDGSAATSNIEVANCYACWVKNVRSVKGNRNHVWLYQSARCVVRDSYFYGTKNAQSQSYGVEPFIANSDDLVENNIFQKVTAPIAMGHSTGSVFGYNYTINSFFTNPPTYMAAAIAGNHDVTAMNLFEGNNSNQVINDNIHGTSNLRTFFRNRIRGYDTPAPGNGTWPYDSMAYNRFDNLVGNVFGTQGIQTIYQLASASEPCENDYRTIFIFGYGGGCVSGVPKIAFDNLVQSTSIRWGNYDVATGTSRFNCSEVDSAGAVPYSRANPCPVTQNLPNSFYLAAQPPFWTTPFGTPPWPAIGPDITAGLAKDGVAGHANPIPAQLCYENTSFDPQFGSNNVLLFSATNCYGGSTAGPAAPSKLSAVVQ